MATLQKQEPLNSSLPGIWYVNNKRANFQLTPGGYITISGFLFGKDTGNVDVVLTTDRQTVSYQVITWRDSQIYARLPAEIRGVHDQAATLQVTTRAGKRYGLENGQFYAAREEIWISGGLDRVIQLQTVANWGQPALQPDGSLERLEQGNNIDCKAPGTDNLYFLPLPNSFEMTGLQLWGGREDAGEGTEDGRAGDRVFTPGYEMGAWSRSSIAVSPSRSIDVDSIQVKWGVWRQHYSEHNTILPFYTDTCESNYKVAIRASGPAGLRPF
jgi:hypothetical protein